MILGTAMFVSGAAWAFGLDPAFPFGMPRTGTQRAISAWDGRTELAKAHVLLGELCGRTQIEFQAVEAGALFVEPSGPGEVIDQWVYTPEGTTPHAYHVPLEVMVDTKAAGGQVLRLLSQARAKWKHFGDPLILSWSENGRRESRLVEAGDEMSGWHQCFEVWRRWDADTAAAVWKQFARAKVAEEEGTLVEWLDPDGAAARAGMQVGDLVIALQGAAITAETLSQGGPGPAGTLDVASPGQPRRQVVLPESWGVTLRPHPSTGGLATRL